MNYHVNLLLDDERRSASPVSAGMVLRMGSFAAVAVLLLFIVMLFMGSRDAQVKAANAQNTWADLEPKYTTLLAQRALRNELRASFREIEACRHSRLPLGDELAQLQLGVPADIQFTSLRFNQFVGKVQKAGTGATRSYELHLTGKVAGDDPKATVDELIKVLSAPDYTNRVESVTVPHNGFRKAVVRVSANETRTDWFFELVCRYRPRSFE